MRRFEILDGLRGVAAVGVLVFHLGAWTGNNWFPHGYLAVDFFFCLSGFVLAHAYERRDMRLSSFVRLRLIRLWPLIALSMLLGAAYGLAKLLVGAPGADSVAGVFKALLLGMLLIPSFWKSHPSYEDRVFPLNSPAWSLFLEVAVNVVWFAARGRLGARTLAVVVVASGMVLALLSIQLGTLEIGQDQQTFWLGFPRALFSFSLGLLIYRRPLKARVPGLILAALLLLVLISPEIGGLFDLAMVTLIFPVIILLGANGEGSAAWRLSGDISYPLYALHAPLWYLGSRGAEMAGLPLSVPVIAMIGGVIVIGSWVALKLYDEPARRLLTLTSKRAGRFR